MKFYTNIEEDRTVTCTSLSCLTRFKVKRGRDFASLATNKDKHKVNPGGRSE